MTEVWTTDTTILAVLALPEKENTYQLDYWIAPIGIEPI